MEITNLIAWVEGEKPRIEAALRQLVEINTYTSNTAGVDAGMAVLEQLATANGLTVESINTRHRLVKAGNGKGRRILLISHMDTVFPPDGSFLRYEPLADGYVRGPGVGDIKGGLLVGLWAMIALHRLHHDFDVQMIVSADEEKGSPTIRDWYMGGHIGAELAIGLEPGFPQGELKPDVPLGVVHQRRGYGAIRFTVKGLAAHSGSAWLGLDAIEAAAHRVLKLRALAERARGTSVTVGMFNGGISANTVAGSVEATVSWRFERMVDGEALKTQIESIITDRYVHNPDLNLWDSAEMTVEAFLPPMEHTPQNQAVIDVVLAQAAALRQNAVAIARGGGSDANFVSASGTPTICGMGVPAQGIHTTQETIYLPGLYDRVALLAASLDRLIVGDHDIAATQSKA